jgi:hypothetical protein
MDWLESTQRPCSAWHGRVLALAQSTVGVIENSAFGQELPKPAQSGARTLREIEVVLFLSDWLAVTCGRIWIIRHNGRPDGF